MFDNFLIYYFVTFQNSHIVGPKCCVCNKCFGDFKSLSHHEKSHLPPFRCRFCSSMFSILKFYKVHLNFHIQQKQRQNARVPDQKMHHNNKQWRNKMTAAAAYKPTSSSSVQTSNQGLLMHLNPNNFPSKHQPQLMRCKYCQKQFGKLSNLKKHQLMHETMDIRPSLPPEVDLMEMRKRSMSRSSNEYSHINQSSASSINKSGLTLTPSLLSNLNKLANLSTSDTRDGKKPAILININTNDSMNDETATKSQEMPVGGNASGLMISSVSSLDKTYYEKMEKNVGSKATVMIQNGKKAIPLTELQCPICKKIVSQPFSLKIHLRTHTMER
jgi:hypothetical protein